MGIGVGLSNEDNEGERLLWGDAVTDAVLHMESDSMGLMEELEVVEMHDVVVGVIECVTAMDKVRKLEDEMEAD